MKLLIQTQLSNYDNNGKFILEADSGYQMMMGRVREMLKLDNELDVDIMLPLYNQIRTSPYQINKDLFERYPGRLQILCHKIIPNALATRYDFDFEGLSKLLFQQDKQYDIVYINDPMLLRNFQALFFIKGKYKPKFVVHSHFIDNPGCPKFPVEASLWMGQIEAARKADWNFWQCESAMQLFFHEMNNDYYNTSIIQDVKNKSTPYDDGYSIEEITTSINYDNIRFDINKFSEIVKDKTVIFVPNRIGGMGRSSDYTNCGKFMERLYELHSYKPDEYVVFCGNPSQKILNSELKELYSKYGYVNLVTDAFNRDEYKFIASRSHIAVGLYNQDTYGGTAARECIELGCFPFWVNCNEYFSIAYKADIQDYLTREDLKNMMQNLVPLMNFMKFNKDAFKTKQENLKKIIRERCSYEATTPYAYKIMKGLL